MTADHRDRDRKQKHVLLWGMEREASLKEGTLFGEAKINEPLRVQITRKIVLQVSIFPLKSIQIAK